MAEDARGATYPRGFSFVTPSTVANQFQGEGCEGCRTRRVTFEVDPRSVLNAIKKMNSAMEGYEKGNVSANDRMQRSMERMADMLLKVNDKSRNSLERLTQSIEKQAAAYGRSGADRMVGSATESSRTR